MLNKLPPREREIVDLLYARGEATAVEIGEALSGNPGNSAVRAMLRRLESKGYVRHRLEGKGFVYAPALPEERVRDSALLNVVKTFFNDSPVNAASALLTISKKLTPDDLDQLERLIAKAREEQDQ